MRITEAKHKKITLGAFYATVNGFGGNATWTHRNVRGMGEILSAKVEFAQKSYEGLITYKKPDFFNFDQTYRALVEVSHEKIHAYNSFLVRFANYIDRPVPIGGYVSAGLKIDHINVSESASNGTYFLIGLPFFGKYDKADDPIDPKMGYTAVYSITPYQALSHANVRFAKQRLTGTCYIPLLPNKKWVLALRAQIGSIAGAKRENIPLTKLFLGGSEDDLRGYKYKTVSPVIGTKPLGGRSAFFGSAELRIRVMEKIGIVPFADFGTVTFSEVPSFDAKWFKSVGLGLRYFAFFGPLRFDIGFPLDRRKKIDSRFQIYASVGQSF
jgi:translocation and assembly module TamA